MRFSAILATLATFAYAEEAVPITGVEVSYSGSGMLKYTSSVTQSTLTLADKTEQN